MVLACAPVGLGCFGAMPSSKKFTFVFPRSGNVFTGSLPEGEQALLGTVGMMAAWVAFAGAMYLARPNSMRPAPNLDEKHSGPGDGGAPRGPEPPAPAV